MENIDGALSDLGYRRRRAEPQCWQLMRMDGPAPEPQYARPPQPSIEEPQHSHSLSFWIRRLFDKPQPSPYQISLALHINGARRGAGRRF